MRAAINAAERRRIFEEATGMNYKEMEDRLKSYINNGKYGWRKLDGPPMPTKDSYAMRAASA